MRPVVRWAVEWHSKNRLDGETRYFMWAGETPLLFRTRARARAHIVEEFGYIKTRLDLQAEPHGWKMPRAVKVEVLLRPAG